MNSVVSQIVICFTAMYLIFIFGMIETRNVMQVVVYKIVPLWLIAALILVATSILK